MYSSDGPYTGQLGNRERGPGRKGDTWTVDWFPG